MASKPIKRKDGRWRMRIYVNGKAKDVYGDTQKEVKQKALELEMQLHKGMDLTSAQMTFSEWAESWLKIKKGSVTDATYNAIQYPLKHLLNRFSDIPIQKIKNLDMQNLIQDLSEVNPSTGKPTAVDTMRKVSNTAHQIFELAVKNQAITFNPANGITIPTFTPPTKRRALTKEEQQWIIDTPHRAQTSAMVMMLSGLRRGELLALTWNDINLVENTIIVNKSVNFMKGKPIIKNYTKTKAGMRTVHIPNILSEYLKTVLKNSIYVSCNASYGIHTESSWVRLWSSYINTLNRKYGDFTGYPNLHNKDTHPLVIPDFTPHWLRHTFATVLYFAGVDLVTAIKQMGHADSKTTLEIYTHLSEEFETIQMDKLNSYYDEWVKTGSSF